MEQEIWKDVPGVPELQASSFGRIRSLRVLKAHPAAGTGYLSIGQKNKTFNVHALVAAAFYGPRPEGKEINHKNSNREDPSPENLEYVTHSENMRHGLIAGNRLRFSEEQMKRIEEFYYVDGLSVLEIARRMECHRNSIRQVLATWKAPRGRRNKYQRKMTPEKKQQIRDIWAMDKVTQVQLGKMFDIDSSAISRILRVSS